MDWLKAFQLPARIFLTLAAIGMVVIFLPSSLADTFGISGLRQDYRGWIGIATIATFVFGISQCISPMRDALLLKRQLRRERKENISKIRSLFFGNEWLHLAYCLYKKRQYHWAPHSSPAIERLREMGLLEVETVMIYGDYNKYKIPCHVWELLHEIESEVLPSSFADDPNFQQAVRTLDEINNRH